MIPTTTKPDPRRLLLVDDHPPIRKALHLSLEAARFQVVGEAGDISEALTQIEATRPHLVVIDINLGHVSGLMLARVVRERYPELSVLIWSMYDEPDLVAEAKDAGACGYVLKSGPMEEIVKAVEVVVEGGCYYSKGVGRPSTSRPQLTTRERQVLKEVARGRSSRQIAKQLKIERRTVEAHRSSVMGKLGAKNAAALIVIALRLGYVAIDDIDDLAE
jgi:DNA-binding NarL/FixJ family response regulator